MTTDSLPTTPPAARPQWWRAATWLAGIQTYVVAWFLPLVVVASAAILAVVSRYVPIQISAVGIALHGGIWVPFSISIILVASYLAALVASGMTRRSVSIGAMLTAVSTGLLYTIGFSLALLAERWAYDRLGWQQSSANHEGLVFGAGVPGVIVGLACLFVAGNVSGLLVAAFYYRFGAWVGTLTLPVSLAPLLLTSLFALDADSQFVPWSAPFLPAPAQPVLGLLLIGAGLALFHLVIRRTPIAAKDA